MQRQRIMSKNVSPGQTIRINMNMSTTETCIITIAVLIIEDGSFFKEKFIFIHLHAIIIVTKPKV